MLIRLSALMTRMEFELEQAKGLVNLFERRED